MQTGYTGRNHKQMSKVKRYIFFLRHFNDIDNIAPAIYFFLEKSQKHLADVVLYQEYDDFKSDRNLQLLNEKFPERFSVTWLGNLYDIPIDEAIQIREKKKAKLNWIKRIGDSLGLPVNSMLSTYKKWKKSLRGGNKKTLNVLSAVSMADIRKGKADKGLIQSGLKKIIEDPVPPNLVIFDAVRSHGVKGLLDNLRELNVKHIICLPVSPLINYNVLRSEYFVDVFSERFRLGHDYSGFDALGYVDHHYVDSYNHFLPMVGVRSDLMGKTERLGSIRFCPEWLPVREQMVSKYHGEYKPGTKKLVFFLSHAASNVNIEEVHRTIQILNLFPNFTVVIKGHTREEDQSYFQDFENVRFENNVDSTSLIQWGDIILFWSTSIAIEGYIKNKTMICLPYIVGNKNLYDKYDAGYVARCRDELVQALIVLSDNTMKLNDNKSGTQQFLDEIIWAKETGLSVPELYLQFMKKYEFEMTDEPHGS